MPVKNLGDLNKAFKEIQKAVGEEQVIMTEDNMKTIHRIPCSSPALSRVLGGGWPIGLVMELYGPESGGKSLIATTAGVDFQKQGLSVAYIDLEYSFNPKFARNLGLNTKDPTKFTLVQPTTGEDAFMIADKFSDLGFDLIIVDSVAGMVPKAELEAEYDEQQMASQARMMGKGLRKLAGKLSKAGTTVIFINQVREKVGVMYGNPEITPGGKALKFYASVRLRVSRKEFIVGPDKEPIGILSGIKANKNKTSAPGKVAELTIKFDGGIDTDNEWVEMAIRYGVIHKAGAWLTLPNEERLQGKAKATEWYKENPSEFDSLKEVVEKTMLGFTKPVDPKAREEEEASSEGSMGEVENEEEET